MAIGRPCAGLRTAAAPRSQPPRAVDTAAQPVPALTLPHPPAPRAGTAGLTRPHPAIPTLPSAWFSQVPVCPKPLRPAGRSLPAHCSQWPSEQKSTEAARARSAPRWGARTLLSVQEAGSSQKGRRGAWQSPPSPRPGPSALSEEGRFQNHSGLDASLGQAPDKRCDTCRRAGPAPGPRPPPSTQAASVLVGALCLSRTRPAGVLWTRMWESGAWSLVALVSDPSDKSSVRQW